jgi:hypothetical protein
MPVVPSDHGYVHVSTRSPRAASSRRSRDTAPRAVYRIKRSTWSRRWAGPGCWYGAQSRGPWRSEDPYVRDVPLHHHIPSPSGEPAVWWRSVRQLPRFGMPAWRMAGFTVLCSTVADRWCRRTMPACGSTDRFEAGKIYCHIQDCPAPGSVRSRAYGTDTAP